jgi:hypothetical protein
MKYALEMGSGAMIYVHTKFHEDLFRYSKVNRGDSQTARTSYKITSILSR